MGTRAVLIALGVLSLLTGIVWGAGIPVTGCREITAPGTYSLQNDILDSDAVACINISSPHVVFLGNGHTIDGQDLPGSQGIINTRWLASDVVVQDVTVADWEFGIHLYQTKNSSIRGSTAMSSRTGIIPGHTNSTIADCQVITSHYGIWAWTHTNFTITNTTIRENLYHGLYLGFSENCTVEHNRIEGNTGFGSFFTNLKNTRISDNYFNNTENVLIKTNVAGNQWNTTLRQGKNIAGGPFLAGNFWANPSGTGFSQTCEDSNGDSICDAAYVLDAENTDYLPLSRVIPRSLPGYSSPPTDPDGDGIYEDLNGNDRLDFADVVLYFNQITWIAANEPIAAFDLNHNNRIDFADIVALFNEI
jgi:parallel beta-helix repeat protein